MTGQTNHASSRYLERSRGRSRLEVVSSFSENWLPLFALKAFIAGRSCWNNLPVCYLPNTTCQSSVAIPIPSNRSVAYQAGARRISGLVGNLTIPRQTGGSSMNWLSTEATATTESTPVFDQVVGAPNTAAAYHEISRQLLIESNPDAEQVVMGSLASDCAVAADAAVFARS